MKQKERLFLNKGMLHGLDLFSGIGGISISLQEWVTTVAYCERDRYAQGVLLSRMAEGSLDYAPIWDDVTTLHGDNLPSIDIIYGGFPCQDISVAGHGVGLEGQRSGLFREIVRLAEEIKPTFLFLENVPAIRTRGLARVIEELTEAGYDCRWCMLSAAEVGANHKRERWFLLAHSRRTLQPWAIVEGTVRVGNPEQNADKLERSSKMADHDSLRMEGARAEQQTAGINKCFRRDWWDVEPDVGGTLNGLSSWLDGFDMTESHKLLLAYGKANNKNPSAIVSILQNSVRSENDWESPRGSGCIPPSEILLAYLRQLSKTSKALDNISSASEETQEGLLRSLRMEKKPSRPPLRWPAIKQRARKHPNTLHLLSSLLALHSEKAWSAYRRENPETVCFWESGIRRVAENIPNRVDKLKCLGNAVVPLQAKTAFKILMGIK